MARKKTADELAWDFDDPRGSDLERIFITRWKQQVYGTIRPVREYRFARPDKEYRFDFAFVEQKVAVEMQGGVHKRGRHNRAQGMRDDYDKHIMATLMGWRIVYLTIDMINDDPTRYINNILSLVYGLKGERNNAA